MEFDMRMGRTVDKSYQLLESHCQLGESDLQKLDDAFSRLTHGRGMMVHKTSDEIKFGAAVNPMDSSDAIGKPTCPYSRRLVYLGENAYPHRLMNATCDCDDCQNEDSALDYMNLGLPRTKACQPQFYHVPIIRYHSLRIQTAPCVIHDFTVEFVKITTGCTCVHLPVWIEVFCSTFLVQIRCNYNPICVLLHFIIQ